MPRGNGTGPEGNGPKTGKGQGRCNPGTGTRNQQGPGQGNGQGRNTEKGAGRNQGGPGQGQGRGAGKGRRNR